MRTSRAKAISIIVSLTSACVQPAVTTAPKTRGAALQLPPPDPITASAMTRAGFNPVLGPRLDSIIGAAISNGASPGAAVAVGRNGHIAYLRGYGRLDWNDPASAAVNENTIYDMASLTKVVATTTVAMLLEEAGQLDLDRTVASYLPEFNAPEKSAITVRHLLTHRGGLEAYAAIYKTARGRADYLREINSRPLKSAPGTATVYSDWDMILLQIVLERVTGQTLDRIVAERVFGPLGMADTRFQPPDSFRARIAPTEMDSARGGLLRGIVHDENAWAMGGVSGHAGLFSTARDLATFAQFLLNGGEYNNVRLLKPSTVARWTSRQSKESSRALGWDTPFPNSSAGHYFAARGFGHTGFTGTSIWIDPEKNLYVVLLTNRVNPSRDNNKHVALRRSVADAVQQAALGSVLVDWEARQ